MVRQKSNVPLTCLSVSWRELVTHPVNEDTVLFHFFPKKICDRTQEVVWRKCESKCRLWTRKLLRSRTGTWKMHLNLQKLFKWKNTCVHCSRLACALGRCRQRATEQLSSHDGSNIFSKAIYPNSGAIFLPCSEACDWQFVYFFIILQILWNDLRPGKPQSASKPAVEAYSTFPKVPWSTETLSKVGTKCSETMFKFLKLKFFMQLRHFLMSQSESGDSRSG